MIKVLKTSKNNVKGISKWLKAQEKLYQKIKEAASTIEVLKVDSVDFEIKVTHFNQICGYFNRNHEKMQQFHMFGSNYDKMFVIAEKTISDVKERIKNKKTPGELNFKNLL